MPSIGIPSKRFVFPVNGSICQAIVSPFVTHFVFAARTRGGWEWRGAPAYKSTSLYRAYLATSVRFELIPWERAASLAIEGAAILGEGIDFKTPTRAGAV